MTPESTLKQLKASFVLPPGKEICIAATADVLGSNVENRQWIKLHFSELVEKIQVAAYKRYLAVEQPAAVRAFRTVFGPHISRNPKADEFFNLLGENFWALDRFFLGLTQGRRPRAGKAFEHVIKALFDKLEYPYTPQPIINGQPDFLLPSEAHFRTNAMDCIIFTVKRTLRERWRQITTEGTHGHVFFLATIDEHVAARDLPEMLKNRIYLVVPETIRKKCYDALGNVISFETFFLQHLDPAMDRWRANKVI